MAKIKLLRIQTPGASPSTSQIDLGELCVHIADGKIFFKTLNGETEQIVALEPNSQVSIGSLNDIDITTVTPTNGQVLVYNSTTEKFEPGNASGASSTNLTYTSSTRVIGSSTGDDATLPEVAAGGDSGLMTGADKTKLDGIETGATADQTANEILTELKTVDGANSGLDSDLLDGQEGSHYLNVNNFTGSEINFDSPNYGSTDDASIKAIAGTLALFAGGNERVRIGGSGNVGIGRTNPNEKLDVENNARVRQDLFVDSQIGLGTTSPTYSKLDCRGKVRAVGTSYDQIKVSREHDPNNDTSFIALGTQSANIASLTAGNGSTGNMDLAISTSSSGTTSEQIRVTHDGLTGFGTDSPVSKIHLHQASTDGFDGLRFTNTDTGVTATDGFVIGLNDEELGKIWHYDNKSIEFGVDNELHGTLRQDGRWCLGPDQVSGSTTLNVYRASGSSAQFHADSDPGIEIKDDSDSSVVEIRHDSGQMVIDLDHTNQVTGESFVIKRDGTSENEAELLRLDSNADLTVQGGIKVKGEFTGDSSELVIEGASPQIRFSDSNEYHHWIHVNVNNFYILSDRDSSGGWESPHPMQLESDTNDAYLFGRRIIDNGDFSVDAGGTFYGELTTRGFDITNTSVPAPTPAQIRRASGNYGTIKVSGSSTGGWKGYAIEDGAVFMQNDAGTVFGLFDDTNNHWAVYHTKNAETRLYYDGSNKLQTTTAGVNISGSLTVDGGTCDGEWQVNGRLDVGTGSGNDHEIRIYKADNNVSDHIQFYNGTTRMGEIGCEDTTWLRINQETNKNIYTPRMIRADNGFKVDGDQYGVTSSGRTAPHPGDVGNPGIRWGNDTDTGFYRSGTNQIGISTGGVNRGVMTGTNFTFKGIYSATSSSGSNIRVNSSGRVRRYTSSRDHKTNIEPMDGSYATKILNEAQPVWYRALVADPSYPQQYLDSLTEGVIPSIDDCESYCFDNEIEWNSEDLHVNEDENPDHSHWGFIAEDLAEVDPRLCDFNPEKGKYDAVNYEVLTPILLKLAQMQKAEITSLENRLAALEQRFNDCSACNP